MLSMRLRKDGYLIVAKASKTPFSSVKTICSSMPPISIDPDMDFKIYQVC